MARTEFSKKIRAQAFLRCKGFCEGCNAHLKVGEGEYDHRIPDALGGEATLDNCQVLCVPCHRGVGAKTAQDVKTIAKVKRIQMKHNGSWKSTGPKIQSRGFQKRTYS